MRAALFLTLLLWAAGAFPQDIQPADARPLVITDAIAMPLSRSQILQAALKSWPYSFGQEPGARMILVDTANGSIKGMARFNFRSTGVGSREESMGVVSYTIAIEAENGQCRVRVGHLNHTGNHNAPGGGIDMGLLYADKRPQTPVPGISMGTANRLHDDMRAQVQARANEVLKVFLGAMRRASDQGR